MKIKTVILILVKVALIGHLRCVRNKCAYLNSDFETDPSRVEVTRLLCCLENGRPIKTEFEDICDILAHTQQTAHIPIEVWERVLENRTESPRVNTWGRSV